MNTIQIAPSILSADLGRLAAQVELVVAGGADMIHIDVMDGRFVPPITFGTNVVTVARRVTDLPLDVHLMVAEPERFIEPFADAGADIFTLHIEATHHVQRHLAAVRERGMRAGIALNPGTPLRDVEEVIRDIDLLLVMSVNPGFGGQAYIPASSAKIARARVLLDDLGSPARLEVDGGISRETIPSAHRAGADTFVAGSAVFSAPDPAEEVRELRRRCAVTV